MPDYKIFLGYIATIIVLIGAFRYVRDMLKGRTRPHTFSWFVWGLLSGIAFVAQITSHGGAGAWITGVTALYSLGISAYALKYGDRKFVVFDWLSLTGALLGIALWILTKQPLAAVVLVSVTDFIGFLPTFRKGFFKPFEETLSEFLFSSLAMLIALFALDSFTPTTALYPASLVVTNGMFVVELLIRRKQLRSASQRVR